MSKRVEKLIPFATEAVESCIQNSDKKVPKEFNGYIASFGASVIQAGLLPTIAFFSNEQAGATEDRYKLPRAILHILRKNNPQIAQNRLLDYVIANNNTQVKKDILDAATALKLAIRTFKLYKKES